MYDTPAYIWEEFTNKKDPKILLDLIINPRRRKQKWIESERIYDLIEKIHAQLIERFPPKNYLKDIAIRKKIALYHWKAVHEDKRSFRTKAILLEQELIAKDKGYSTGKFSYYEDCAKITKHFNVKINPRKLSIFDYRNYLELIVQEIKEEKWRQRKKISKR